MNYSGRMTSTPPPPRLSGARMLRYALMALVIAALGFVALANRRRRRRPQPRRAR